ncbi:MAG: hypothetical protein ACO3HN_06350 [Opitutales bacterium]
MTTRGGATVTVTVKGIDGIRRAIRPWLDPELTLQLDAANKKAAQAMAKELRTEIRPVSKHMAKAVRVRRAKTGKPGWVVGSRRKAAFFWPFVIGGTKDHGPRAGRAALVFVPGWNPYLGASSKGVGDKWVRARSVSGVRANPLVEKVAKRMEGRVMQGIDNDMKRSTGT